ATPWAVGASAACSKRTGCALNSRARLCPAQPIPTRPCGPRPTAYSANGPPPPLMAGIGVELVQLMVTPYFIF
ncbi:hypothetical protein, partial [Hymenobacter terrenus]|uniref:hypothetical protein n=1 Tax=Hymenobacter terrenus TaxID=1629124 RepID=UPI000619DC3F